MVDRKVLIGVPTGEYARRADFYDYYNLLSKPVGTMAMFVHGPSPAKNRNQIIDQAIEHKCSHVLFIDDDSAFKSDALIQLLEHDKDIVCGLQLRREYPHQPLIFDHMKSDGQSLYSYLNGDETRLKRIAACGFGFVLIKTTVFEKMEKPWVRIGELDPQEWSDDIGFFKRAREAGVTEMYCDMECRIGHISTMVVWPNKVDGKWYTGYDTRGDEGMLNTPQIMPAIQQTGVKNG